MNIRRKSVAANVTLPLTISEAKQALRVDVPDDDALITDLVRAAADFVQDQTWSSLYVQTWELILPGFPGCVGYRDCPCYWRARPEAIRLPRPPAASVVAITYRDADGAAVVVDSDDYQLVTAEDGAWIVPAYGLTWPAANSEAAEPVLVEYTAGYDGSTRPFPGQAKQAVRMLTAHWYENREAVLVGTSSKELEIAVAQLCRNLSFWRF